MPSIFTQIIDGKMPGHFVWKDEVCVAFLTIAPLKPGHTLVVPPPPIAVATRELASGTARAETAVAARTWRGCVRRRRWEGHAARMCCARDRQDDVSGGWSARTGKQQDARP